MLEALQGRLPTSVAHSRSIDMHHEVGKRTADIIRQAERREHPFDNLSTQRKKTLLIGLLAKPLVEPSEN